MMRRVGAVGRIAASAIKQTLFRARCSLIDCVRFRMKEQNQ